MAPKILIVLTSHSQLGDTGKNTGWYLPEFAHPYDTFAAAGATITVASPAGGIAPLDPSSVEAYKEDPSSVNFLSNKKPLWESTVPVSSLLGHADEYDAIFFPGGHGPMWDLATDEASQKLAAEFAEKGKVVSAVCHGPAALANVKLSNGEWLLKGKTVTGFSDEEEELMKLDKVVPFLLETRMKEVIGGEGEFVKAAEPWGEKVVVDGKIVTGQNPASAKAIGEAILKAV